MFLPVKPILTQKGLAFPDLIVLRAHAALYNCLLLQPNEQIEFGDDFMRTANSERMVDKCNRFFDLAVHRGSALVLAPEYCCPTDSIRYIISVGHLPTENHIWAFGSESIKARELAALISDHPIVEWIYDEGLVNGNLDNDRFFNPIYQIFSVRQINTGELKTVVLVQFKTHHPGGGGLLWERNNMIQGSTIYVLENGNAAVRMICLNCADVFNPEIVLENLDHYNMVPYLLIHLQLNPAPNNINYRRYRGLSYGKGNGNIECICLNWAKDLHVGNTANWSSYGGSAIYMQLLHGKNVDTSDKRMINNELKGLYYSRWTDRRADVYFFNYDEFVYEVRKEATNQNNADPQVRGNSGPEMEHTYAWDQKTSQWNAILPVDPGFQVGCSMLKDLGDFAYIQKICAANPIDAERLISLSTGNALDQNWHQPPHHIFFQIDDNELPARTTFTQNPDTNKNALRKDHLLKYGKLEYKIITLAGHFPDALKEMRGNCRIGYREAGFENQFHLNLYPKDNVGLPLTGVYLGEKNSEDAKSIFDKIAEKIAPEVGMLRLIVWWYGNDNKVQKVYQKKKPRITDTAKNLRSIKKNMEP